MLKNCGVAVRGAHFEENDTLLFHGHLFSRHPSQDLAFAKFSNPCLVVKFVSRNTCFNEEHNLKGWKLCVQYLFFSYGILNTVLP